MNDAFGIEEPVSAARRTDPQLHWPVDPVHPSAEIIFSPFDIGKVIFFQVAHLDLLAPSGNTDAPATFLLDFAGDNQWIVRWGGGHPSIWREASLDRGCLVQFTNFSRVIVPDFGDLASGLLVTVLVTVLLWSRLAHDDTRHQHIVGESGSG